MADYEAQIVVIAGGPSGLSAAVQAAEDGADVILLEKNAAVGGAANMGMGPLAIGSHYQQRQMIDITVEKALNMFMEYTHYNVDGRLVKRYFEQSAETIEWLEDMGVEFEGAYKYFTKSEATWHIVKTDQGIGPRAASFMNKALYDRALELGVQVMLETPAKKILKDEEGKVCGVLATNKEGKEIEIACKAAIICCGGGGANPDFIKEQTGYTFGVDMFNFAVPGNVGDGIKMAWEAGAAQVPVRIEQAANFEGIDELPQSVPNVLMQPNLLVNKFGKRVMDEEQMQNTTYLSNAASHQKGRVLYSIVDTTIVKDYIRNGVDEISMVRFNPDVSDFFEGVEIAEKTGNKGLFKADTLEELAEKCGIDVDVALSIEIDDEVIEKRMTGRRSCTACCATYHVVANPPKMEGVCDNCGGELTIRKDDKPETVKNRLKVYHQETEPLIDFYKSRGKLKSVENRDTIEATTEAIFAALEI